MDNWSLHDLIYSSDCDRVRCSWLESRQKFSNRVWKWACHILLLHGIVMVPENKSLRQALGSWLEPGTCIVSNCCDHSSSSCLKLFRTSFCVDELLWSHTSVLHSTAANGTYEAWVGAFIWRVHSCLWHSQNFSCTMSFRDICLYSMVELVIYKILQLCSPLISTCPHDFSFLFSFSQNIFKWHHYFIVVMNANDFFN